MKPALLLSLSVLLAAIACGTEQVVTSPPGGDAGKPSSAQAGAASGDGTNFGASACRVCQAEACASPEADCLSEPGCAQFLDCLDRCPVGKQGDADETCARDCELSGQGSLAILAHAVITCRQHGHGLDCPCADRPPTVDLLKQECGTSQETNPCYKCEDEKCCQTFTACFDDEECHAFTDCLKVCTLDAFGDCELECGALHPTGFQRGLERVSCVLQLCSDGDQCGEGPLDPCVKCVNQRCTEEGVACDTSIRCTRVSACAQKCGTDGSCVLSCYDLDVEGAALFQAFIGCGVERCASECG